ncbi:MAG: acyl carrier protein phosphodiesterase [Planctomycetota bacterium]
MIRPAPGGAGLLPRTGRLASRLAFKSIWTDTGRVNFLAHLLLAPSTPEGRVGCLLPDLVRGPIPPGLNPRVLAAAHEHQAIDRFTDRHAAFLSTRERLRPATGRFAGVCADILFDHALASRWPDFHPGPLPSYTATIAKDLNEHHHLMPPTMRVITYRMTREDWLTTYATVAGIRLTLARLSRRITVRLGRAVDLCPAADSLDDPDQIKALHQDFDQLWPDLLRCVSDYRSKQSSIQRPAL